MDRWIAAFKEIHKRAPDREDIELVAPQHVRDEYNRLYPSKEVLEARRKRIKLKRSFDDDDDDSMLKLLPKKHKNDSDSENQSQRSERSFTDLRGSEPFVVINKAVEENVSISCSPPLSSTFVHPETGGKGPTVRIFKESTYNEYEEEDVDENRPRCLGRVSYITDFDTTASSSRLSQLTDFSEISTSQQWSQKSSSVDVSPVKPAFMSQPVSARSVTDYFSSQTERRASAPADNSPSENDNEEDHVFPDQSDQVKRSIPRKKKESGNFRRLNMKHTYTQGKFKAKFKNWRRNRKKR